MQRLFTPLCLVLCLALLVTAFGLLAMDAPEPDIALHRARAARDEALEEVLERDLRQRIWLRRTLITALFVSALGIGAFAFLNVPGSDP
jgi:hypothetical protein